MNCAHCNKTYHTDIGIICKICESKSSKEVSLCPKCVKGSDDHHKRDRDKSPERGKKSYGCSVCTTNYADHWMCRDLKEQYDNLLLIHNRLDNASRACQKIIDAIDSPGTVKQSELYYQTSVLGDELDVARKLSDNICE